MNHLVPFSLYESVSDEVLYHATTRAWTTPQIFGIGFHAGTLKAAMDRAKSFPYWEKEYIVVHKLRMDLQNPLRLNRDYRFHNDLARVAKELYKDSVLDRNEKDSFVNIYAPDANFENLRTLLYKKYGYDGITYRNNIEDKGSMSYIAFFPEQITLLGKV